MDFVFPILFVLSLFGNYLQHGKVGDLNDQVEDIQEVADKNYQAYITAKEANDTYEDILIALESELDDCSKETNKLLDTIDGWRDSERIQMAVIKDLKDRLSGVDFGPSCRVPEWVDFEAHGKDSSSR